MWLLTAVIPLKPVYNKRRYTYQAYRLSKYVSSPVLYFHGYPTSIHRPSLLTFSHSKRP